LKVPNLPREDVDDADGPKVAILALLLDLHRKGLEAAVADNGAEAEAELEALRAKLAPMKMSQLKKRVLAAGVDGEAIAEAMDAVGSYGCCWTHTGALRAAHFLH
jgi:hypothetical protein